MGAYIPKNRLKIDAIAEFLGEDVNELKDDIIRLEVGTFIEWGLKNEWFNL